VHASRRYNRWSATGLSKSSAKDNPIAEGS